MAEISKLKLPTGTSYDIKDATARTDITNLKDKLDTLSSYTKYLGVTTTKLTENATTNPIVISSNNITATVGDIANYGSKEFIFNGSKWQEFGDLSGLGALAYKDRVSGTVSIPSAFTVSDTTPEGNIVNAKFDGTQKTYTASSSSAVTISSTTPATAKPANYTPEGQVEGTVSITNHAHSIDFISGSASSTVSGTTTVTTAAPATYTPAGNVSAPKFTATTQIKDCVTSWNAGSASSWSFTVADETLTIGGSNGSAPSLSHSGVTFVTDGTVDAPKFTGTPVRLTTASHTHSIKNNTGSAGSGTFDINAGFTGTSTYLSGTAAAQSISIKPEGNVSATFQGKEHTHTVTIKTNSSKTITSS